MQFIDLEHQYGLIKQDVDQAVLKVLAHGKYILGPEVKEFESDLAKFTGSQYCLGCSSGTDALTMALMALDIKDGDAVFTTPFTFFATVETIAREGATPVFSDIDPDTYNMDPEKLEMSIQKVISEGRLRPRAIIPVDLFGLCADYSRIIPIAEKYGLEIIEDAAQGFGACQNGRKAPTFGTIGCTSFFPAKPLGCYGDGGAVFTDDEGLYEKLNSILVHGRGSDKYDNVRLGINARLDTIQAAILIQKLKLFPSEIEQRQVVAQTYIKSLQGAVKLPLIPEGNVSVWAQFSIQSPKREKIMAALKHAGIPTACYYPIPMHLLKAMSYLGHKKGDMPIAEQVAEQIFSLPMHPYLERKTIETICEEIKKAL